MVPSQTELLFYLGLGKSVAGITKFCVHPVSKIEGKIIIGGTKNFWFDKIEEIQPDLIIGNKEENYQEGIAQLAEKFPVWISDISNQEEALDMISSIGEMTDTAPRAQFLILQILSSLNSLTERKRTRVVYLIWKSPWMAAGTGTFINCWLEKLGFENVISGGRYPNITNEELQRLNPELILLSSEPFPFKENHLKELKELLPQTRIELVDGEMFSWYGNRMLAAIPYFNSLPF